MVYGVLRLINFAHGDLFTLGSYLGLTLLFSLGLQGKMSGILVGGALIVMSMGLVAVVGYLLERVAYRPLRGSNRLAAVVSALGASIFFSNAIMLVYGARSQVYPNGILPSVAVSLLGVDIPLMRIVMFVGTVVLMLRCTGSSTIPASGRPSVPSPSIRTQPSSWASMWTTSSR